MKLITKLVTMDIDKNIKRDYLWSMCDETYPRAKKKYVSFAQVKAEQQKVLDQFIAELESLQEAGVSLREIATMKKMNHETVRQLINSKGKSRQIYTRT